MCLFLAVKHDVLLKRGFGGQFRSRARDVPLIPCCSLSVSPVFMHRCFSRSGATTQKGVLVALQLRALIVMRDVSLHRNAGCSI